MGWWSEFFANWSGRRLFLSREPILVPCIASDAATSAGIGAIFKEEQLQEDLPERLQGHDINELELYGVVRAFLKWAPKLEGGFVVMLCDNSAAVGACRKLSSPVPRLNSLLKQFVLTAAKHNVSVSVQHIPGVKNVAADCLSRNKPIPAEYLQGIQRSVNLADVFDHF